MRGSFLIRLLPLVAALWLAPAVSPVRAADPRPEGAAASPWEHPLWHNATTLMRLYVCDHARRPPSWCAEEQPPAPVALPDAQGPPLLPEDAAWQAFLSTAVPAKLSEEEVAMVRRRAVERRDPQAMEILGFLYAEGLSVPRDYVEAYRWYGQAFLAGETGVRANMDIVWQLLQRHDLEGALALTREFEALAAGDVPEGLAPGAAAGKSAGSLETTLTTDSPAAAR